MPAQSVPRICARPVFMIVFNIGLKNEFPKVLKSSY